MKIIKPSVEWTYEKPDGMKFLQAIELAGRCCYKSEDKIGWKMICKNCGKTYYSESDWSCPNCGLVNLIDITEGNWKSEEKIGYNYHCKYCDKLFGWINHEDKSPEEINKLLRTTECPNCDSKDLEFVPTAIKFIRNLINRGHLAMIEHAPDISMRFICDRGVSHEIVRHRLFSFAQESTRYVNYGRKDMEFILPCWMGEKYLEIFAQKDWTLDQVSDTALAWYRAMEQAKMYYNDLLVLGWTPQKARSVLPNSLKTEIVVKGNAREWMHFFELRCAKTSHPQMREVALMALRKCHEAIPVIFDKLAEKYMEFIDGKKE